MKRQFLVKHLRDRVALLLWGTTILLCVYVILHTRFIADLSAFMPKAPTARQQMLVDQLRDGAIARLVLLGIEGGDEQQRAKLSRELAAQLSRSTIFSGVQNGDPQMMELDQRYFFDNRYLLSPAITAERFTASGLHDAIQTTLDEMSGDAGLLIKKILPRDPSGETMQLLDQFIGESQPRTIDGVWASRDGRRAVLMLQIRQSGLDTDAMALALDEIQRTFDHLPSRTANTKLAMSGTAVLSVASRNLIHSEVARLATIGTVLVVCLLLLIYRSFSLLILGLIPVVTGALVGIASVSLFFGHVHGLTLGFGTTLIGEAVDYSIYLFVQGAGRVNASGFWRTIRLGVLMSLTGFGALLCASFPGLSQLGLYTISGLLAAALVTRYLLPSLIPEKAKLRDLALAAKQLQKLLDYSGRLRWFAYLTLMLAIGVLVFHQSDIWSRQLSALSPISPAQSELDASLRSALGDSHMQYVASFTASSQEDALQVAERVSVVLHQQLDQKTIGGFHLPSQLLPSEATQRARLAALPVSEQMRTNLDAALQGLPITADKLQDFLADIEATRLRSPLTREALQGTSLAVLLDSMLIRRAADYLVLMPLRPPGDGPQGDLIDIDKISTALQRNQLNNVAIIDVLEETTNIFDSYMHEVLTLSSIGCLAIALLLMLFCKFKRAFRIILPLTCAVVCVTAILVASGVKLTLLHLVGLLLVVAVGSNYALFFAKERDAAATIGQEKIDISVVIANLATVASFGLLGTSSVPVLSSIGYTVAIGTFLALVFSAILSRTPTSPKTTSAAH
jgi:predicted exporter